MRLSGCVQLRALLVLHVVVWVLCTVPRRAQARIRNDGVDDTQSGNRAKGNAIVTVPPRQHVGEVGGLEWVALTHRCARVHGARIPAWQALTIVVSAREDAQAVPMVIMGLVAVKPCNWNPLWANSPRTPLELGSAAYLRLGKEPKPVVRRASGDVIGNVVVTIDEPVRGRRGVSIQSDERLASDRSEVASDDILALDAVLDEIRVPARVESNCCSKDVSALPVREQVRRGT